jgi:hypothetical protein
MGGKKEKQIKFRNPEHPFKKCKEGRREEKRDMIKAGLARRIMVKLSEKRYCTSKNL